MKDLATFAGQWVAFMGYVGRQDKVTADVLAHGRLFEDVMADARRCLAGAVHLVNGKTFTMIYMPEKPACESHLPS